MGKLFFSEQKKLLDAATMKAENINSYYLMERAALNIVSVLVNKSDLRKKTFLIVCGTGNNGGDGLAVAKILSSMKINVRAVFCNFTEKYTESCEENLNILKEKYPQNLKIINTASELQIFENELIIDAIFGNGLNRKVDGEFAKIIQKINSTSNYKIAIDIPSGLFGENNNNNCDEIIKANKTLYIEFPALSLLFQENYKYCGILEKINIKINKTAIENTDTQYYNIDNELILKIKKKREPFSHKANFGHALIFAGSKGYAGAAVLAAKACLRAGSGLLTLNSVEENRTIIQTAVPEAIFCSDFLEKNVKNKKSINKKELYSAFGVGPGIGILKNFSKLKTIMTENCLKTNKKYIPIVLDADALNIIAKNSKLHKKFFDYGTIITPHPKEFERLFGDFTSTWDKLQFMKNYSETNKVVIILKGGITYISTTIGNIYFNIGLNPGMATAGSGDVLTGIITALLAQNYEPDIAAILGVYMHSKAGERAKQKFEEIAMIASDIIDNI